MEGLAATSFNSKSPARPRPLPSLDRGICAFNASFLPPMVLPFAETPTKGRNLDRTTPPIPPRPRPARRGQRRLRRDPAAARLAREDRGGRPRPERCRGGRARPRARAARDPDGRVHAASERFRCDPAHHRPATGHTDRDAHLVRRPGRPGARARLRRSRLPDQGPRSRRPGGSGDRRAGTPLSRRVALVAGGRPHMSARAGRRLSVLVVDDDDNLRALLRATFEVADIEIAEARDAAEAAVAIERARPDVVLLDVDMPGVDGLTFCRSLKASPETKDLRVVLLTGSVGGDARGAAAACGADALVEKPFSPLDLLATIEQVAARGADPALTTPREPRTKEQLLLYADDLRRLLEIERGQRALLQRAYRDTVTALATALESKDSGTGAHSQRVQQYAVALTKNVEPALLDDPSLEYGFLLHDIGKIGIPDSILLKPAALSAAELRLMHTHTVLGEQMLGGVALLQGEGLRVVRSHHERWDGGGYPDGLAGTAIPIGARIFAVADTLDAVVSERPYRRARPWSTAVDEVDGGAGRQFDPRVARALHECEGELQAISAAFAA